MRREIIALFAIIIISSITSVYAFEPITIYDENVYFGFTAENMKFICPGDSEHNNTTIDLPRYRPGTSSGITIKTTDFSSQSAIFGIADGKYFKLSGMFVNSNFPCDNETHDLAFDMYGVCNYSGPITDDNFLFEMGDLFHDIVPIIGTSTISTSCSTPLSLLQPPGTVFPTCEFPQTLDYESLTCIGASIGPPGQDGAQGIQGIAGEQGPIGLTGQQGIQGPKGDKGDQGIQGPIGFQGLHGIQGLQGVQGPIGPQGPQGDKGDIACSGTLKLVDNNCVPRIIEITGYDTRDRERLTYYQSANAISAGVAGNGVNFDERGVFTINNEKIFPEEIIQVSLGNQDYFYIPSNSISPWNDDAGFIPGTYTILESSNRGTGNQFAAMLAPEKKQAIIIDYEENLAIGSVVDLEIYLKSGEVLTKAITIGSFVPAVGDFS